MATSKGKISDAASPVLRPAAAADGSDVLVGNEQVANVWDDEDASDREAVKGPDPAQWPVETRDKRLSINKPGDPDIEDGAEGMVKGPDPAQHPERPWAAEVGKLDPDAPVPDDQPEE